MTPHPIPADADLISLVTLNKQYELEDALAARKARRLARYSARARKAAQTRWRKIVERNPFGRDPALALRAEPASGLDAPRFDPAQGAQVFKGESK